LGAGTTDAVHGERSAEALPARRGHRQPAWRLLLAHVSPHRWTLLAGGLLGFLGGLASLAQPMVAKLVVDTLGERRSLVGPVAVLTGLAIGGALLSTAGIYLLGRTAETVVLTARERLISRLLRLRVGALDRLKPGDLLSRVTSDTTLLRSVSTYGLVHSVNAMFLLVGCVLLMALLDHVLLLVVTFAVLAINGVAVLLVVPRIRRATERSQVAVGRMGSVRVASGALPVSSLVAFLLYLFLLSEPISSLVNGATQLQAGLAAVVRLRELEHMPVELTLPGAAAPSPLAPGSGPTSVVFKEVWFRYRYPPGSAWVHRRLTLEVPPGGMTGIHFESGDQQGRALGRLAGYDVWTKAQDYFNGTATATT
jgi:ABC-type multidrug transport system fused ATPase/permease subunit